MHNKGFRSRSRDNRVQLGRDEEQEQPSYAKVDHFNKHKAKKPPIPKEVLEIEEQVFKLRDENSRLQKELDESRTEHDK